MEKLTKNISDIIIDEINLINEKVKGLNFLENLKTSVIEKLLTLLNNQTFPLKKILKYEKEIQENTRDLKISINYYDESISNSKNTIKNDTLFLVFNESAKFDIYKNENDYTSLYLNSKTGISLPRDTVINSKYNKNILLIEIINKDIEQALTK